MLLFWVMTKMFFGIIILASSLAITIARPTKMLSAADTEEQHILIPVEWVRPGDFYYPVKRAWEKLRMILTFSLDSKIDYRGLLLKKRLSDLKYIIERKRLGEIENASNRFSYEAGELTNLIEKTGRKEETEKYINEFGRYALILSQFRDQYPANTSNWLLIQQNIDTLHFLQDRLR